MVPDYGIPDNSAFSGFMNACALCFHTFPGFRSCRTHRTFPLFSDIAFPDPSHLPFRSGSRTRMGFHFPLRKQIPNRMNSSILCPIMQPHAETSPYPSICVHTKVPAIRTAHTPEGACLRGAPLTGTPPCIWRYKRGGLCSYGTGGAPSASSGRWSARGPARR